MVCKVRQSERVPARQNAQRSVQRLLDVGPRAAATLACTPGLCVDQGVVVARQDLIVLLRDVWKVGHLPAQQLTAQLCSAYVSRPTDAHFRAGRIGSQGARRLLSPILPVLASAHICPTRTGLSCAAAERAARVVRLRVDDSGMQRGDISSRQMAA